MVKLVEWKSESRWIDYDAEPLAFLLTKYGRYLGTDDYDDFTVHNYADISFERPWLFYEQPEPLTINYDGGIALQGLPSATTQSNSRLDNCSTWDRSALCGGSCNGRPSRDWISIM